MQQIRPHDSSKSTATEVGPIVSVRDLAVDFKTVEATIRAVDGVSFDIVPRRTLGIVGESGCGKSVTARAIMRIEDGPICKLHGNIFLHDGQEAVDLVQLDARGARLRSIRGREIGLIFQEPMTSFSPVHTIGNQIMEAVRIHFSVSRKEAEQRSIEQLRDVGMPHAEYIMKQYAWELSGGLRQRAMIAMALVCGPRLLIADEPTTALDVTTQAQVLRLLADLQERNDMALMLITHDLGVIAESADDVVIMYLGSIVERGPVHAILDNPMHPYTQLLLESLPDITKRRSGRLKTIPGTVPRARNRPHGCPFHTRCPSVIAGTCDEVTPGETRISPDRIVNCHLHSAT